MHSQAHSILILLGRIPDQGPSFTATLVEPRVTLPLSWNRTKIRLLAGSNGIGPVLVTNTPKVGVALATIDVVTLLLGGDRQTPVTESVWQRVIFNGKLALPVSALTVIVPETPTFKLATTKPPVLPMPPGR